MIAQGANHAHIYNDRSRYEVAQNGDQEIEETKMWKGIKLSVFYCWEQSFSKQNQSVNVVACFLFLIIVVCVFSKNQNPKKKTFN